MKVVCIDNINWNDHLTIGKIYEEVEDQGDYWGVKNDKGTYRSGYRKCRFVVIKEEEVKEYEYDYSNWDLGLED